MDFALARHNMVEGQIRTNKVTDPFVVEVLDALERESFVPLALKPLAYIDEDLIVGRGRILMEPMVLARLMQFAALENTDLALVIGAATGYEAVAISKIVSAVVAIESDADLHRMAAENAASHGADTVSVISGDLTQGDSAQGPYDVIFINGAVGELPSGLTDQLADGGRMVFVQSGAGTGKAMLVSKVQGIVSQTELFDANVPPLPEFTAKAQFSF